MAILFRYYLQTPDGCIDSNASIREYLPIDKYGKITMFVTGSQIGEIRFIGLNRELTDYEEMHNNVVVTSYPTNVQDDISELLAALM